MGKQVGVAGRTLRAPNRQGSWFRVIPLGPRPSGEWTVGAASPTDTRHRQLTRVDLRVCGFQPYNSAHSCWNSAKCLTTSYLILPTSLGGRHHVPIYRWSKMRLRGTVTHLRSQGKRISGPEPLILIAAPLSWRALP